MKPALLFITLLTGFQLSAQPYKSIFGQHTTEWKIEGHNVVYLRSSIFVDKDTIIDGYSWKILKSDQPGTYSGALVREDTITVKDQVPQIVCCMAFIKYM